MIHTTPFRRTTISFPNITNMDNLIKAFQNVSCNIPDCDGFPCAYCKKEIDIVEREDGTIDRSNRVDTDMSVGESLRAFHRSYHLRCWRRAIWD